MHVGAKIALSTALLALLGCTTTGKQASGTGSAAPALAADAAAPLPPPALTPFIVVDQFGYLPDAEKIAVIRDPEIGFDKDQSFQPGGKYVVVNAATGEKVHEGAPVVWNKGEVCKSSGDRAWRYDFSALTAEGSYFVQDIERNVKSPSFRIDANVYRDVLKHAMRTFFYQRVGFEKKAEFAGEAWADGASHAGPLQDKNARLYNKPDDKKTERDLSGGWYDAGDYNKYTSWSATYLVMMLRAYEHNPAAFADDYNIPESGNGIPDVIDEAKFGMDWLVRMQNPDGSVLSVMGLAHASPPSKADGKSLYGSASTSATIAAAGAYAYGAKVFRKLGKPELDKYADDLVARAKKAYRWAEANPNVLFYNNSAKHQTQGLAAGQQEMDDYGRFWRKVAAAIYLFEVTGEAKYRKFVDDNYGKIHLMEWKFAFPFEYDQQDTLLYYTSVPNATPAVVEAIKETYRTTIVGEHNVDALRKDLDPYLAYMKDYVWGSNATKSGQGSMMVDAIVYGVSPELEAEFMRYGQRYLHYIHGVNPLGLVYLTNMSSLGATRSTNEFYHSWFADGSPKWDRVGVSTYGPPPGFLPGGPNGKYDWDGCCPKGCGSTENNQRCHAEPIEPPKGQPDQKSYKDFNTNWPLNSWQVTENANGYQLAYIRLLSKYVK